MTPLDYALAAVRDLTLRYRWLEESVVVGTPRPYRAPTLSPEARQEADARARDERHERVNIAPGDSPDPYHFDVADLRSDVLVLADAMAEQVAQAAGVERMPDASFGSDAVPYLAHVLRHLRQASEVDGELPAKVERKARQYVTRVDALLGVMTDGQVIPAVCFVCGGRDAQHPVGGAHTLRFRLKHSDHDVTEHCTEWCRAYAVCEGGMCAPTPEESGYRYRGRPAWDWLNESEWLLDRLGVTDLRDQVDRCRCGKVVPEPKAPGPKPLHCSAACRVAAHRAKAA